MGKKIPLFITVYNINNLEQMVVLTIPSAVLPRVYVYSGIEMWLGLGMATVCLNNLFKHLGTCVL